MKFVAALSLLVIASLSACGNDDPPKADPADDSRLAPLVDENPDPKVVEVHLEAKLASKVFGAAPATPVWTYNGSVPGPLIDVHVGDRLIVHFKNSLPEPTSIHWHGVRLPAPMDGTMATQAAIQPGASFDYTFVLKDPGLFWFHPHVRSDVQVNKGLYGALRVTGDREPAADQEKILVLDDIKLKPDGTISEFLDDTSSMMGRGGNTILVNGSASAVLRFRPNATVRLRIVNAANGRFFNLALPGAKLRIIGTDGGLIAKPYDVDHLLMAPGERYDVMVALSGAAGASLDLVTDAYDRGHDSRSDPSLKVATVLVDGAAVSARKEMPTAQPAVQPIPTPTDTFPLVLDEKTLPNGEFAFTINGKTFPDVPVLMVPRGAVRAFEIKNDSEMDHPFHLHGFFFQVVERKGVRVPQDELVNKDTVIVPMKSSLKLNVLFDEPGMWMYHCHILEHAEHGMMGEVHVE
jgi:FtsP/CotA-like multicopper oxidase with cupredoxin domain